MRLSSFMLSALLAVLTTNLPSVLTLHEDFSDDFEVEIDASSRKLWKNEKITATVGKAFHLVLPKDSFGTDTVHGYEVSNFLWKKTFSLTKCFD